MTIYYNRGGYRYQPRALGLNPRAQGTNPRALGRTKRTRRAYSTRLMAALYNSKIAQLNRHQRIAWALERIEAPAGSDGRLVDQLREIINFERYDQGYAEKARHEGVDYAVHLGGLYWRRIRYRKFIAVDWICERCGDQPAELEAHHRHYDTLGFEEIDDLEALCGECHRLEHDRHRRSRVGRK